MLKIKLSFAIDAAATPPLWWRSADEAIYITFTPLADTYAFIILRHIR